MGQWIRLRPVPARTVTEEFKPLSKEISQLPRERRPVPFYVSMASAWLIPSDDGGDEDGGLRLPHQVNRHWRIERHQHDEHRPRPASRVLLARGRISRQPEVRLNEWPRGIPDGLHVCHSPHGDG